MKQEVCKSSHAHIVMNERQPHHESWGGAFGEGLKRHGWNVTAGKEPKPCDLLVMWGVRQSGWIQQQKSNGEVCILERGYVGDRFKWTSVSFGGRLNGRGNFYGPFHDGTRWEKNFGDLMHPRKYKPNKYALILGQVDGDMSVKNVNLDAWYKTATEAYQKAGFQTKFRAHPNRNPNTTPLLEDLQDAAVAVTYNSNSGVDAGLFGIPVVAMDKGSMAWDIAGHELGVIPEPIDRKAWAYRLAWCQYTREEIESGYCWASIDYGRYNSSIS